MKAMGMVFIAGAVALLFWLTAKSWHSPRQLITVDGSSTVYPLTAAVAQQFHRLTDGVRVSVGISGTGGGFKKFCRAETDLHGASRPITNDERRTCARRGVQYYELPVALDPITIVVSQENPWADSMTLEELKTVWEPGAHGRMVHWRQIRGDWPDTPVKLFGPRPDSGTFDYFTDGLPSGLKGVSGLIRFRAEGKARVVGG